MKTIFSLILAVALLIGAQSVFANHIPMPNLPIGETASRIENGQEACGEVIAYAFPDPRRSSGEVWHIITLNSRWLIIADLLTNEGWLDRNLDGHLDERWTDPTAFLKKYPTLCSILDKSSQ